MKTFYKQGGLGHAVRAIFIITDKPNEDGLYGYGFTFGSKPSVIEIEKGFEIVNAVEITEKEYNSHYDSWSILLGTANLEDDDQEKVFSPRVKYTLILGDLVIEGYSERSADSLNKFLQDQRGKCYTMHDESGSLRAFINQDISYKASYIFEQV